MIQEAIIIPGRVVCPGMRATALLPLYRPQGYCFCYREHIFELEIADKRLVCCTVLVGNRDVSESFP